MRRTYLFDPALIMTFQELIVLGQDGGTYVYEFGRVSIEGGSTSCQTPPKMLVHWRDSRDLATSESCGKEVDRSGGSPKVILHPRKCRMGCGEFRPLLSPGAYVTKSPIRVYAHAKESARVSFTLQRGQTVRLLKDVLPLRRRGGDVAPWAQIQAADGRTGWVFGGDLEFLNLWSLRAEDACKHGAEVGW